MKHQVKLTMKGRKTRTKNKAFLLVLTMKAAWMDALDIDSGARHSAPPRLPSFFQKGIEVILFFAYFTP